MWRTVREAAERMALRASDGVRFQFSPETFNLTEPDYVLELCDGLTELWDASPDRPVTHNLPATVEIATPNVYADQIEYMHRHLARRDAVILSVHPHNDRGTGVACAELAVLAGAQRVEGCLFGNGERTSRRCRCASGRDLERKETPDETVPPHVLAAAKAFAEALEAGRR